MIGMFISAGVMGCGIDSATSAQAFDANISPALIGLLGLLLGVFITGLWNYFIARGNYRNQLRLAALDKRLAVHQEAYYRCARLLKYRHSNNETERIDVREECENWFLNNCLYMGPKSKEKFDRLLYGYGMDKDNKDFMNLYFYPAIKALEGEVALPLLKKGGYIWSKTYS